MKMLRVPARLVIAAIICVSALAEPPWTVTRTANFELWSDADPHTVTSTLAWFEQLRAFSLQHIGLTGGNVTVVVFRNADDYNALRPTRDAAAFFAGSGSRSYIVMAAARAGASAIAAHEYAHSLLHASGARLPLWLSEGLAEVYSSVRITLHSSAIGGDLPGRTAALTQFAWMPLPELVSATSEPQNSALFYAQSWALARMLLFSPQYAPRFPALLAALSSTAGPQALAAIYGKPLDDIVRDLHTWTASQRFAGVSLGGIETSPPAATSSTATPFERRRLMAKIVAASGDRDRAIALFTQLQRDAPGDPDIPAALGEIALQRADHPATLHAWKQAIDNGSHDPQLCYRYANLAQQAGYSDADVRPALERAIALDPAFDDARYELALIEMNAGEFEQCIAQLRAMRRIAPHHAFAYWSAMANALNELDRRSDAKAAAIEAGRHATTPAEHARAAELAWIADTDLTVRFERDASGAAHFVTTRTPRDSPGWNPFIEPGDQMRRIDGTLQNIDCSGSATRLTIASAHQKVTLTIPDPSRVAMHNAPAEFVCGPQSAHVVVDYAAQNSVVRAMDFK